MRDLSFIGMILTIPVLAWLGPLLGGYLAPGPWPPVSPPGASYQFPRRLQTMTDFNYQITRAGQEALSFSGQQIALHKAKLGLLRFALLQELQIDQGVLVIRQPAPAGETTAGSSPRPAPALAELAGVFTLFPATHLTGLICQPLRITFRAEESGQEATIKAKTARIAANQPTIHLSGGVQLNASDTVLTTDQLDLDPINSTIVTQSYTISTAQGSRQGQKLRTDIFLRALKEDIL